MKGHIVLKLLWDRFIDLVLGLPGERQRRAAWWRGIPERHRSHRAFVRQLKQANKEQREYDQEIAEQRAREAAAYSRPPAKPTYETCPQCGGETLLHDYARETMVNGFSCVMNECNFRYGTTGWLVDCPSCSRKNAVDTANGCKQCLFCSYTDPADLVVVDGGRRFEDRDGAV